MCFKLVQDTSYVFLKCLTLVQDQFQMFKEPQNVFLTVVQCFLQNRSGYLFNYFKDGPGAAECVLNQSKRGS
jgi:hypothetical protein